MARRVEELAAMVFAARDAAHRAHWRTREYAAHVALGEFYTAVIDALDEIVEVYQGENEVLLTVPAPGSVSGGVRELLTAQAQWIATHRTDIAGGSDAIGNLVDNLVAIYRKTVYKLKFLS